MPRKPRHRRIGYPNDVTAVQIPEAAMHAARTETYRFLQNYHLWRGDLASLCACCYLQGALDGAQVQQGLAQEERHA